MSAHRTAAVVDVARLIDEGAWSAYQKILVALTALAIVFDGADIQLAGLAVPAMMADWGAPRTAFAPVLASGLVGMMIGGALGGVAGDRLGRRTALVASLITFGLLTFAIVFADGLATLAVLRFLAGLGFGGTVPNAAALASEYVPARHRPFAVTVTIVCVPLGGTLASLVASLILPHFGWRALFGVGGVMPLVAALVLIALLPESPRYLARHPARWSELARILRRAGHEVSPDAAFAEPLAGTARRASPAALFAPDLRRDTLALWSAFAFCLLAVYTGFNWVPSMMTGVGIAVGVASAGLAAFNLGGVGGAIAGALAIARFGSRATISGMAVGAVAGALVMSAMRISGDSHPASIVLMLGVVGGLINAVQTTMYALAAHVYPTAVRATGVGSAASVGRLGAIASTWAGAAALEAGGTQLFFGFIAAAMVVVTVSLALLRRHIPQVAR